MANVIGISYNGVAAAGKDIAHVLLCDVMKLFCNDNSIALEATSASHFVSQDTRRAQAKKNCKVSRFFVN